MQSTLEVLTNRTDLALLDTIFRQAMVGMLHRDLDGRVLMVNDRFCELVGRSAGGLAGLPMESFIHPEDHARNAALAADHLSTGQPYQIEKRYLRPDGTVIWCEVNVSFVRDERGDISSTIAIAQDITARRVAQQAVREREELLQTVIESLSDLIFVKDREGRYVLANRPCLDAFGDIIGKTDRDFLPEEKADSFRADDQRVIATGDAVVIDEQVPVKGDIRNFETIKVPWRSGESVLGIIAVARDVTDWQRAQDALRESEEHYRYSVELNPQIPWLAGPDGAIEEVSPRWKELTGLGDDQALGDAWLASVHPDDVPHSTAAWLQAVETGEPYDVEFRIRTTDGSYRWVRVRATARRDEEGNIIRWYGTAEDIDEKRRAEARLQLLQAELIHVSRVGAMGAMASALAHELNQPLTAAANYVQGTRTLIREAGDAVPDMALTGLAEAKDNIARAGEIIRRIRALVSRGPVQQKIEDLPALIRESCRIALVDAAALGIHYRLDLDPRADRVFADHVQVQQVLLNLLRNATEAVRDADRREIVIGTSRRSDRFCEIMVADSGPGIDPSMLGSLFSPFNSSKEGGMGVGLSISRTIVEAHGGQIQHQKGDNGGAIFRFSLPVGKLD